MCKCDSNLAYPVQIDTSFKDLPVWYSSTALANIERLFTSVQVLQPLNLTRKPRPFTIRM